MRDLQLSKTHALEVIGRAGASPPSRYVGAPLYIFLYMSSGDEAFLVPAGPRATGKRKAGSITSGYLRAETRYVLRYLQASLGYCIASHDSDYPRPLARQRSERSYRWLRRYTRQGLATCSSVGATLGTIIAYWSCDEAGLGLGYLSYVLQASLG